MFRECFANVPSFILKCCLLMFSFKSIYLFGDVQILRGHSFYHFANIVTLECSMNILKNV